MPRGGRIGGRFLSHCRVDLRDQTHSGRIGSIERGREDGCISHGWRGDDDGVRGDTRDFGWKEGKIQIIVESHRERETDSLLLDSYFYELLLSSNFSQEYQCYQNLALHLYSL